MDSVPSQIDRQRRYGTLLLQLADVCGAAGAGGGPSPLAAVVVALGAHFGTDECAVSRVDVAAGSLTVLAAGAGGAIHVRMPWLVARMQAGDTVCFADPGDLPAAAVDLRRWAQSAGISAHVTVPLRVEADLRGGLHLSSRRPGRSWTPAQVRELEVLATFLAPALERLAPDEAGDLPGASSERLEDVERAHVLAVVQRSGWRINGVGNAAERLGLHPNTLRSKMKKLGIARPRPRATRAAS